MMDMINTQMFPEVSSSSVSLKQQEVVNFFKGEETMINAFQSLDESYQRFAQPYTDIPGNSEYTACFAKFFIKNIDQPVEVLETMITHYQVAEVGLTLSSHLLHGKSSLICHFLYSIIAARQYGFVFRSGSQILC